MAKVFGAAAEESPLKNVTELMKSHFLPMLDTSMTESLDLAA